MKFDTSQIENFESMSAEEKLAAILDADLPDVDDLKKTNTSYKALIDKYTSEIASLKKGKDQKLSQTEQEAQGLKSQLDDLQSKYDSLMKESSISKYKAQLLALGYSDELATKTAEAAAENDIETVLANAAIFKSDVEKKVKADVLKGTPHPEGKGSNTPKPMTKAEIMAIKDSGERQKAIAEHYDLFTQKG